MTDKAYIVANEQQEREVLEKLEQEGLMWTTGRKPTERMPSSISFSEFPYVLFSRNRLSWGLIGSLSDEEIVYDGRKREDENMSNNSDMTLTIFTNNGQSFMFKHVTDFKYTTTGFEFSYTGEMTGVERHAVFNNTSVAGYALAD